METFKVLLNVVCTKRAVSNALFQCFGVASTSRRGLFTSKIAHVHRLGGKFEFKVKDIIKEWSKLFSESGVQDPQPSIEHIVAYALNSKKISDVYRYQNKRLTSNQMSSIIKMCKMRLNKMPIQYVLGEWDFRNLTLKMQPPVFIPRPESEALVDLVSAEIGEKVSEILELCCGSGAISLALLKLHPNLKITAIDKSGEACALARENAKLHDLSTRLHVIEKQINQDSVSNFIDKKFDLIVSNPPYVPSFQMANLQPEIILYEDPDALDGGKDGLDLIKIILNISSRTLNKHGKLFLEVDSCHPEMLRRWIEENDHLGLSVLNVHKDFLRCDRFLEIVKIKES